MKTCTCCKQSKAESEFYRHKKYGYQYWCKVCKNKNRAKDDHKYNYKESYCYKITIKNIVYIGSTQLQSRKYDHLYKLRNNKHTNKYLQKAFNRYTESEFIFKKLIVSDLDNCRKIEHMLINNNVCCNINGVL